MVSKHYSGNEGNNVPLPESKREYTSVIWRVVLNFESVSLALVPRRGVENPMFSFSVFGARSNSCLFVFTYCTDSVYVTAHRVFRIQVLSII